MKRDFELLFVCLLVKQHWQIAIWSSFKSGQITQSQTNFCM